MENQMPINNLDVAGKPVADPLHSLRERALDYASEAVFVPPGGDMRDAYRRAARSELVLLEKATYGDFMTPEVIEAALKEFAAAKSATPEAAPAPPSPATPPSIPRRWWMLGRFFRRIPTPAPAPIENARFRDLDDGLRQIADARLREARHKTFVDDRLALLEAEFDVQLNRASAAMNIAAVTTPKTETNGAGSPENNPSKGTQKNDSNVSVIQ
jgi:hypothetical protein